jgi:hypothetical protein
VAVEERRAAMLGLAAYVHHLPAVSARVPCQVA